jgi:hypothetical protein
MSGRDPQPTPPQPQLPDEVPPLLQPQFPDDCPQLSQHPSNRGTQHLIMSVTLGILHLLAVIIRLPLGVT